MSDSEDEDYAFFGTPLDQFDEDAIPRKKPITVEEQIATDRHGKRRFHGAFTGGFSAGFFNSVGSLEGWKPSSFKSSRSDRIQVNQQLPSHFMDDEDTDEFGFAPQVLKTKGDYASAKNNTKKRGRDDVFNSGPIPGVPVLQSILKPAKHTIGIILLMKMGWKPGQDIGEKLERRSNRLIDSGQKSKAKVYGCARAPDDTTFSAATTQDSDSDLEDEIYRELGKKAPRFVLKEDMMGLGYKGLDRNALSFGKKSIQPITIRDQFNKTIKISGQAFGVGAFEEEDDYIYCTDDKSQYDFSLEPISHSKKKRKDIPAVTDGSGVIMGFVKASFKERIPHYPGPIVPASFSGQHVEKQSRFDVRVSAGNNLPTRQRLDAGLRGVILDSEQLPVRIKEEKPEEDEAEQTSQTSITADVALSNQNKEGSKDWKPFASDPFKQERYEKYLNLIKIGAKDLVHTILLNTMSDLERESELREFECSARLYSGKLVSDRFTHGQSLQDGTEIKQEVAAPSEKIERRRITTDWAPHPIVSKRFNLKPPENASGTTLQKVAENKKRPKFSVFDFLNSSKTTDLLNMVESNAGNNSNLASSNDNEDICEVLTGQAAIISQKQQVSSESNLDNTQSVSAIVIGENAAVSPSFDEDNEEFDHPVDKMDLFKAIFLDTDEDSSNEDITQNDDKNTEENIVVADNKIDKHVNALRNTSPPRGIFANLDLDKLSNWKSQNQSSGVLKLTDPPQSIFEAQKANESKSIIVETETTQILQDSYGPALPLAPSDKKSSYVDLKLDLKDDRWVEKLPKKKSHKSKRHHKKKHKKDRKKERHKKKKKRSRSSSDSESDSSSD